MKFLIVGDGHSTIHERAHCNALKKLGHEVHLFAWHEYFNRFRFDNISAIRKFYLKVQNKLIAGNVIKRINADLIKLTDSFQPDVLFIYHGTHILKETIMSVRKKGVLVAGYNNDDPFSPDARYSLWRHFIRCIPHYDINFVYRKHNIDDYLQAGGKNVHLLRSYYIPGKTCPVELTSKEKKQYECDVIFAGHYEEDGRKEYLEEIVKQGFKLKLFGPEWDHAIKKSKYLLQYYPVSTVRDEEYNKALNGAKIALCFLSKLNRDTYTRRSFEIPATKTFMLSEHTNDLAGIFTEGTEAEYFRNKSEFIEKIRFYIKNDKKRLLIAENGHERVTIDRHDIYSRMQHVIDIIGNYTQQHK